MINYKIVFKKRPFIRACRLFSRSAGDCESLNLRSQQEVTGLIAHKAIDTGSSSQSLFQAHKRREPQVETQDLTIMNTTSQLLENSIPQPQRKVIAPFHAFILPKEEEPNSIKIDRNQNSVIILAENIGHTTHPLSDSSEMKIEDGYTEHNRNSWGVRPMTEGGWEGDRRRGV
ncbi:hypothetical protein Pst134EA_009616 [Puccinia striiformis f. sp. tritici]|uniref:hypothetical protein n=1 Tax=Puccinia striiformis f. sp. tritici TaxID=168172 RepID=UPI002007B67D|nr:hypothetical protein Pst134EA_009616 [Puccinia striiformis f. sp. tritici]KAH9469091.1 hypothetical protein Pst134EA_009616 [Puccinia striiformis f. sp. tritici]